MKRRLLALTLGLIFAMGVCEVVLRIALPQTVGGAHQTALHEDDPDILFRNRPGARAGKVSINSHGFRGEEFPRQPPEGETRYLILGDSFTIADAMDVEDSFCGVVEAHLARTAGKGRVRVINGGVGAQGTWQSLGLFNKYASDLGARTVVLAFFIGNDIGENLRIGREAFTGPARERSGWCRFKRWRKDTMRNSHLYRLVRRALAFAEHGGADGGTFKQKSFDKIEFQRLVVCRPALLKEALWQRAWRDTEAYLAELRDAVRASGAAFRVVILPDQFQLEDKVYAGAKAFGGLTDADLDRDLPQKKLNAMLQKLGVPTLDLLPILRAHYTAGGTTLFMLRDTHFNEQGHRVVGTAMAEFLKDGG